LAHVAAVRVGQADVDHERVRRPLARAAHGVAAARHRAHVEPLLAEPAREQLPQLAVVLHDEQPRRAHRSSPTSMASVSARAAPLRAAAAAGPALRARPRPRWPQAPPHRVRAGTPTAPPARPVAGRTRAGAWRPASRTAASR